MPRMSAGYCPHTLRTVFVIVEGVIRSPVFGTSEQPSVVRSEATIYL